MSEPARAPQHHSPRQPTMQDKMRSGQSFTVNAMDMKF
jgi:hypothetical protein